MFGYRKFFTSIADPCCPSVELSTAGPSNATQAVRMGVYHRYHFNSSFSSRPIYVHSARREFLFYVDGRSRGLWMVGPEVGRFSGGLANRGDEECPDRLHNDWKYADVTGWQTDAGVQVRCKDVGTGKREIETPSIHSKVQCIPDIRPEVGPEKIGYKANFRMVPISLF